MILQKQETVENICCALYSTDEIDLSFLLCIMRKLNKIFYELLHVIDKNAISVFPIINVFEFEG